MGDFIAASVDGTNFEMGETSSEPRREPRRLRVAVIGSGLAGLSTAYLLRQQGVEVWILEKSEKLGFHSSSVDIPPSCSPESEGHHEKRDAKGKGKEKWTIDVPMRSFQGGYYPLLISLYRHLQIPLIPTFYTFSFSSIPYSSPRVKELGETYFIYSGASGRSLPALPSPYLRDAYAVLLGILSFVSMALCFLLWSIIAFLAYHDLLPLPLGRSTPLAELARGVGTRLERPLGTGLVGSWVWTPLGTVWEDFVARVVIPIFSAVGTMTSQDVLRTPIGHLLDYAHTTIGTPHYTLAPGVTAATVAEMLVAPIRAQGDEYVRLGEGVEGLREVPGGVVVETAGGEVEVDKVVIATQPTAARALLEMVEGSLAKEGDKVEMRRVRRMKEALGNVESRETIVITHRDHSVLPPTPDRREINLHLPEPPSSASPFTSAGQGEVPHFPPSRESIYTMATHVITPPSHLRGKYHTVLQTTNPVVPIDPGAVISISRLERALPLKEPRSTLMDLYPPAEDGQVGSMHLVGSYAYPGIPLLEGCVGSSRRAVQAITGHMGDVDWDAGQGSRMGRLWRWRRRGITAF